MVVGTIVASSQGFYKPAIDFKINIQFPMLPFYLLIFEKVKLIQCNVHSEYRVLEGNVRYQKRQIGLWK